MKVGWLEVVIATVFITVLLSLILARGRSWLDASFWKIPAIISPIVMGATLVVLTIDSLSKVAIGKGRVLSPTVINKEIGYVYVEERQRMEPVVGNKEIGLFGRVWSEPEAKELINKGKLVIQSRNCMDCHTLLGNGAYYAPDLTKAWLDPRWENLIKDLVNAQSKEEAMKVWLMNPDKYPTSSRKMPNLKLTEEEARALVAYLKWMSAINTNGFPPNFPEVKPTN